MLAGGEFDSQTEQRGTEKSKGGLPGDAFAGAGGSLAGEGNDVDEAKSSCWRAS